MLKTETNKKFSKKTWTQNTEFILKSIFKTKLNAKVVTTVKNRCLI